MGQIKIKLLTQFPYLRLTIHAPYERPPKEKYYSEGFHDDGDMWAGGKQLVLI